MSIYSEKLKDPRWQKKRLEVLERDEFTCQKCADKETELHVHHKAYKFGIQPWEYDLNNLETLCKRCHALVEWHKVEKKTMCYSHSQETGVGLKSWVCAKSESGAYSVGIFTYHNDSDRLEFHFTIDEESVCWFSSLINRSKTFLNG